MPRRPHRKSRNGCAQCKRRHVKCDENRPTCVNCVTANLRCQFQDEPITQNTSSRASTPTPTSSNGGQYERGLHKVDWSPPTTDLGLNMDHLGLLHHYCTVTCDTLSTTESQRSVWRSVAVHNAMSYPFLMYQILAIAALHLSLSDSDKSLYFRHKATEYQTTALAGCIAELPNTNNKSSAAIFLFSSLNAIYVLADPGRSPANTFDDYFSSFLDSLNLLRSIKTILVDWRHGLLEGGVGPLVNIRREIDDVSRVTLRPELAHLLELIKFTVQDTAIVDPYFHALRVLEKVFSEVDIMDNEDATLHLLFAWPVVVMEEFMELLRAEQPPALVILAHYAILLHSRHKHWALSGTGKYLIDAISARLGPAWDEWLMFPKQVISKITSPQTSNPSHTPGTQNSEISV